MAKKEEYHNLKDLQSDDLNLEKKKKFQNA